MRGVELVRMRVSRTHVRTSRRFHGFAHGFGFGLNYFTNQPTPKLNKLYYVMHGLEPYIQKPRQLSTTDILALRSMKNAAKCDT